MTKVEQILSAEEPLLKPTASSPFLPQCSCSSVCVLELSPPGGEKVGLSTYCPLASSWGLNQDQYFQDLHGFMRGRDERLRRKIIAEKKACS
jgi:hypothetical protein